MQTEKQGFDEWALVELMGHQRIAGRVTEQELGDKKLLRVDVPPVGGGSAQAVTKLFGPGAIYGITILTEETALRMAVQIDTAPMSAWDARELVKRMDATKPNTLPSTVQYDDEEEDVDMVGTDPFIP